MREYITEKDVAYFERELNREYNLWIVVWVILFWPVAIVIWIFKESQKADFYRTYQAQYEKPVQVRANPKPTPAPKPRKQAPVKPKRDPYRPSEAFYVIWLICACVLAAGIIFISLWALIGGAS